MATIENIAYTPKIHPVTPYSLILNFMIILKFVVITIKLYSCFIFVCISDPWFSFPCFWILYSHIEYFHILSLLSLFYIILVRVIIFIVVHLPFYEYITMYLSILMLVAIWEFPDQEDHYEQCCDYEQACTLYCIPVHKSLQRVCQGVEWLGQRACKSSAVFSKVHQIKLPTAAYESSCSTSSPNTW